VEDRRIIALVKFAGIHREDAAGGDITVDEGVGDGFGLELLVDEGADSDGGDSLNISRSRSPGNTVENMHRLRRLHLECGQLDTHTSSFFLISGYRGAAREI
ncbi:MAG: hypothetical protein CUN53_11275, partial [Phototrophicales bacterium]